MLLTLASLYRNALTQEGVPEPQPEAAPAVDRGRDGGHPRYIDPREVYGRPKLLEAVEEVKEEAREVIRHPHVPQKVASSLQGKVGALASQVARIEKQIAAIETAAEVEKATSAVRKAMDRVQSVRTELREVERKAEARVEAIRRDDEEVMRVVERNIDSELEETWRQILTQSRRR